MGYIIVITVALIACIAGVDGDRSEEKSDPMSGGDIMWAIAMIIFIVVCIINF